MNIDRDKVAGAAMLAFFALGQFDESKKASEYLKRRRARAARAAKQEQQHG